MCVCVCACVKERKKERKKERERKRERMVVMKTQKRMRVRCGGHEQQRVRRRRRDVVGIGVGVVLSREVEARREEERGNREADVHVASAKILSKPDVYFLEPSKNNAAVSSPVALRMATKSVLRLVPKTSTSSDIDADANRLGEEDIPGYLVVLVDDANAPYKAGKPVPMDETHLHLLNGESTLDLELAKGKHTLGVHFVSPNGKSLGPRTFSTINVTVL